VASGAAATAQLPRSVLQKANCAKQPRSALCCSCCSPQEAQHGHQRVPLDPVRGVGAATAQAQQQAVSMGCERGGGATTAAGKQATYALTVTARRREGATRTADPAHSNTAQRQDPALPLPASARPADRGPADVAHAAA
jgi:hypothetical protein